MAVIITSSLAKFVELRMKLLNAELTVARLVGRAADEGRLRSELLFLELSPGDALMQRIGPGKLVAESRSLPGLRDFDRQMEAASRRLNELAAEVREWRAKCSRTAG